MILIFSPMAKLLSFPLSKNRSGINSNSPCKVSIGIKPSTALGSSANKPKEVTPEITASYYRKLSLAKNGRPTKAKGR